MTLLNEHLCFYNLRLSSFYLHAPWVSSHGSCHHVSTVALNGQSALQRAFRHFVVLANKTLTQ